MRALAKILAVVVAMSGTAMAHEETVKPDTVETASADTASEKAYAKLNGKRAGQEREFEIAPGVMMTFSWCPPGEFMMGSNPLDGIGPYGQPHPEKNKGPNLLVVGVSWDDAQVFMEKVNSTRGSEDGGKMALPTEAQYEYAARAGETGMYPGGSLDEVAWYDGNSGGYMKPVGTKKANAWGLHDMNGSTWEWVQDCYYEELPGGTDPIAKEIGPDRVIRGGAWLTPAMLGRSGNRAFHFPPDTRSDYVGFRVALVSED